MSYPSTEKLNDNRMINLDIGDLMYDVGKSVTQTELMGNQED